MPKTHWRRLKNYLAHSLVGRFGLVLAALILAALTGMGASVIVADTAQGDAAAINKAGALRMQSYRIASLLAPENPPATVAQDLADAVQGFDERLYDHELTDAIPVAGTHPIRVQYETVVERWELQLRPHSVDGSITTATRTAFLGEVFSFVGDIHRLVDGLEENAEAKITRLRLIQVSAIATIVLLALLALRQLHTRAVVPLRDLQRAAHQARAGDLSARVHHQGPDELGVLASSFNNMAETLSQLRASLEQRVHDQTVELQRANQALQLLYDMARDINPETIDQTDLRHLFRQLEQVTGLGPTTLCLAQPGDTPVYRRVSTALDGGLHHCFESQCALCQRNTGVQRPGRRSPNLLQFPLMEEQHPFGTLLVEHPPGQVPNNWARQLTETVAGHIAATCSLARQAEQDRRLALMEERAVIARELHDSLAQSLSYLKIQVTRLAQAIERDTVDPQRTGEVVQELRTGLNSAYRQLRELLTTFRLKAKQPGLEPALRETVDEFARKGELPVVLDYQPAHHSLSPNEEIHLLQIVREALSNVLHHAEASAVQVRLQALEGGEVQVIVDDNGLGLTEAGTERGHHGLAIMTERADSLGGTLEVLPRAKGGTRVRLVFAPESMRRLAAN